VVSDPTCDEVHIAIRKFGWYKSPVVDQNLAQSIGTGDKTLCSEMHRLIYYD
jgi:hypothetical protein